MARLILVNGPPGAGKSTIARMYTAEHPLALNLDIDLIRSLLGRWKQDLTGAGLRARAIALAAARVQLDAGSDVVVPQFLGRAGFVEQLEELALTTGAEFHEIVLMVPKTEAIGRFEQRTRESADPGHREAAEVIADDPDALATMYDHLTTLLADRPNARLVDVVAGDPDTTYAAVLAALGN